MLRRFATVPLLCLFGAACVPKAQVAEPAASGSEPASRTSGPGDAGSPPQGEPQTISFASEPEFVAKPIGKLRRGINLGNGFDAPSIGAWGVVVVEKHFEMAAAAGLDHVRLPVRFSAHAAKKAPFTIDAGFFTKIDWAIDQALSRNLSIIVDLHHYEELMEQPDEEAERLVALWDQLARRYASRPPEVLFELVNEPCKKLDPQKNNQLARRLIATIRKTNPKRSIIVDSYFWAAANQLSHLDLPDDPNVAASFHMYQPILFTHQGAHWMDPEYQTRGIVFPGPGPVPVQPVPAAASTPWVRDWLGAYNEQPAESNPNSPSAVATEFDFATRYAQKTGRAVYMGEFGAIDFADAVSRENYLRLVRREAERRGFAWAYWDDGGSNQAMKVNAGTWRGEIARALFTDQPGQPVPNLGAPVE